MEKKSSSKVSKILAVSIFILIVFFISILLLWELLRFTIIFKIFDYVVKNIVNVSGISPWLAKGLVIFLIIPFFWALGEIFRIRFKLNIFSKKPIRSYRKIGMVVVIAYIGLFFLSMFFFSRSTYFGHTTGEVLKWYAETPEGIRFFDSPGFDPKYGIKLRPVAPGMMDKFQRKALGMQPRRIVIESLEGFEFFDSITGEPKIWYYIDKDGNYEFFDKSGFHPIYNIELKPVTPEIVSAYKEKIKVAYLSKYMNLSIANNPSTREVSVLVVDEESRQMHDIEEIIASSIKSVDLNPILTLFRNPFIKEGIFELIFSGDTRKIKELRLEKHTDYIALGKKSSSYRTCPELQNLISADVTIALKILSAEKGVVVSSTILSATGAGFSNSDAEKRAMEILHTKINDYLKVAF